MIKSRNDRHDLDATEARLIRVGHYLWRLRASKALTSDERIEIEGALEIVWQAKREYRAELAERRRIKGQEFGARMRRKHGSESQTAGN